MEPHRTVPTGGLRTDEDAYYDAFTLFLSHSDEKALTHAYFDDVVRHLPARRVFLDVGAGDGVTSRYVGRSFRRTVCVEPSATMRRAIARACPDAEVVAEPVARARPGVLADLALLSHVLYYVPRAEWAATVRRVLGWVAPGGTLLVLMQDPDNPSMRMVRHFTGARFGLADLADELTAADGAGDLGDLRLESVPALYRSADLEETVTVAGFLLSVPAHHRPDHGTEPTRDAVREYARRYFADGDGTYRIDHRQDVLRIRRAAT
ncbi:class I SAM-dependent methyltransferase [Streptomyces sp. CRN 30]|uniref:class I SAM-dependent methyltransferase n=1 Tax=Streptomyces sp. CRN 30 TaxID=3075613 RepID=UPI002A7EA6C4|nr:methyltransferase domain-containing protein [Streptomyces sp. CRN 30]